MTIQVQVWGQKGRATELTDCTMRSIDGAAERLAKRLNLRVGSVTPQGDSGAQRQYSVTLCTRTGSVEGSFWMGLTVQA